MILFKKLRYKNLLSTGNSFIELDLNKKNNTIIIGESGSGKSCILDAISFGLFNKPFRNISKPHLINAINDKQCVVEVEFSIGEKEYLIRRGIKPNIFEIYCDGDLVNQDANSRDYQQYLEKNILKFNYKAFTQIVVLGAADFVPFMQLKPADRRNIIEGLLDIEIFSVMNFILKQKISNMKQDISDNEMNSTIIKEKISSHKKYLLSISNNKEMELHENIKKIKENEEQIRILEAENIKHESTIEDLKRKISFKYEVLNDLDNVKTINRKLNERYKKLDNEIIFYTKNDSCPTCKQNLQEKFKNDQISSKTKLKEEVESGIKQSCDKLDQLSLKLNDAKEFEDQISLLTNTVVDNHNNISVYKKYIKKLAQESIQLKNQIQNDSNKDQELDVLENQLKEIQSEKEQHINNRAIYDVAAMILKDNGVKSKIIKQYLPLINKYTNMFLQKMNFFVTFHIDEEFNEQIKSRGRDPFVYFNLSEGERQRLDLALLFTWRMIAKLKNSVSTNLLILDEVMDSFLDPIATDNVISLIKSELFQDMNIFVISHKFDIVDKFEDTIRFVKQRNFSRIEQ